MSIAKIVNVKSMGKPWKQVNDDKRTWPRIDVPVMIYKKSTGSIIKLAKYEDFLMKENDEKIYWRYLGRGDFPPIEW